MKVKVDIFSDVICPWCYVGKKRLEKAVAALGGQNDISVTWHPFQLNPGTPPEGWVRQEYLSRKFGGPERLRALDARMKEVGIAEGISFEPDRMKRVPNTLNAHRLIWLAGQEGRQDAVVENLFRAHFTEGRHIGDPQVLTDIGIASGLEKDRVADFLTGDEGREEVLAEEQRIREAGIRGVPLFLINGDVVIEGAEAPETFIQAIEGLPTASPGK